MKRVLVGGPVRQKPAILREFLRGLERLETEGLAVAWVFIDDHGEEEGEARELLSRFAAGRENVRVLSGEGNSAYLCDEETHHWREDLIRKVAAHKDRLIQLARDEGFDYVFLVDSDLVLHPRTLVHLAGLNKDIVSEVFWTRWRPDLPPLPQVWVGDQYRLHHAGPGEILDDEEIGRRQREFLEMLRRPGTYKVGGLGACTLISRKAILAGVSFRRIYNLGLTGEDRHFCVRAAALGLELWADTHYPPYHIYRESELAGLGAYLKTVLPDGAARRPAGRRPGSRISLAMLVRNEADRYLERVLRHAALYIDRAVILDDASEDRTVDVCRRALGDIPLELVSNSTPSFDNEVALRRQLWELAVAIGPDWILILDADEVFEDRAVRVLPELAARPDVDVWSFRLYDMWDEGHYREDPWWRAHHYYRPFMVRYVPGFAYRWRETPQHCGRFPVNITEFRTAASDLRVKHLGWMKPADRLAKYYRYKRLDPEGRYGFKEQYLSILDPRPNLIPWTD